MALCALSTTAHPNTSTRLCPNYQRPHGLHAFTRLAARAWSPSRWERRHPAKAWEKRRLHHFRHCSHRPRKALMHAAADRQRHQFRRYRRQMLAVTPYDCGSPGRFSIPCYVVSCESHYSWSAYNASSGATGPYQMLPSTYASVCRLCDWSHDDQHRAARAVWIRSGGSEWSCA